MHVEHGKLLTDALYPPKLIIELIDHGAIAVEGSRNVMVAIQFAFRASREAPSVFMMSK